MHAPQSVEQRVCLFAISDKETQGGIKLVLVNERHRYYMDDGAIFIDHIEVAIPISQHIDLAELRLKAIETLKEKQAQVQREAFERIQQLQVKIEELQLLEYKP